MSEIIYITTSVPAAWYWGLSILIALLLPTLPLAIIRSLNVEDTRKEAIENQFDSAIPKNHNINKVVLLTVSGWPSMEEVVYTDTTTGPTPVGFEFNADTIADDIGSALSGRGIEVQNIEISDLENVEDIGDADLAAVIFPTRHRQLPWQLLAFFDEVVEPRVAAYKTPLRGIPIATLALGDLEEDVAEGCAHIERIRSRYNFVLLSNEGIIGTPDRLALYDTTLTFAEGLLQTTLSRGAAKRTDER